MKLNFLSKYELNFKEFLVLMKLPGIFGPRATNPMMPQAVSLVDLMVNLSKLDLKVVNEKRFLMFCNEGPPLPGVPAMYN
jgi:hypothetical protein